MINRICISINNRCNLACNYCHFHKKGAIDAREMNVFEILDNVKHYAKGSFKIGFVGNGEPLLDWRSLKEYVSYLADDPNIRIYTITNGTVRLPDEEWLFLEKSSVNVGFSIDGYKELHDKLRCNSFDLAMKNVEEYRRVTGHYPTFNATVGEDSLKNSEKVIDFFRPFGTKVTFSRMIGEGGISLSDYHAFLNRAEQEIPVRRGGLDCTMYGGKCGAGTNNFFFANGKVYFCGNCVDLPSVGESSMIFEDLEKISISFDRNFCYKESL
ncbi:MAG: radical SAM protein [Lachnospiraceae bacterium]|nr:radical SAM protein [Lachnospiraceae bacterium]MBR7080117.1 radical SAM protein [Treponema sp.]